MPGHGIVHVCVFVFACVHKSQPPRRLRGPWCRSLEAYFRSWAVFDGGDLFSVGLYMVAPRLAEGALRNVADLSKKTGLERARRERYGGGIFGVRNASKHQ